METISSDDGRLPYGDAVGLFGDDGALSASGAKFLFAPYVASWSAGRVLRLKDGVTAREADVTAVLCALQGEAEDALIDYLLAAAELPAARRESHRYQLIHPNEVIVNRRERSPGRLTAVTPDIVVQRVAKSPEETAELVVAVEVKLNAAVNYVDCPAGVHLDYSNQLICYVHSCWLSAESPSRDTIQYVWMAPAADLEPGRFPRHALNGTERQYRAWQATPKAYEDQLVARDLWHRARLEGAAAALERSVPEVASLIRTWGRL